MDKSKISVEAMREWCEKLGMDASGSADDLVERLDEYHRGPIKGELLVCDECGAEGDGGLPVCPYCGIGDDEEGEPAGKAQPEKPAPGKKDPVAKKTDKKTSKPAKEKPAPKAKPKKPPRVAVEKNANAALAVVAPAADEAPVEVLGSEAELDEALKHVIELHHSAVVNYWEVGRELHRIFKSRLYVVRKGTDGTPKYKSWSQFVVAEVGVSAQYSYRIMEVATMYSREQVAEIGISKLSLMAQLDEAERKKLMDRSVGMSKGEVASEVRQLTGGTRKTPTVSQKAGRAGFKGGSAAAKKGSKVHSENAAAARAAKPSASSSQITVASLLGRVTIPLFKKDSKVRAMKLGDAPVGTEAMVNGVTVSYKVVLQPKGLAIVVERTREG